MPVEGRGGAGEVERDDGEHQPGGVGGEHPGGQVRQGGVLQVGVDLLDDRVAAVGLVRGDGVQDSGSVVVKNAWNRHMSNRVSWPAALCFSALRSGIRRTTSRPGHLVGLLLRGERGERDLGDLGPGDPAAGWSRRRRRRCTRWWSTRRRRWRRSPSLTLGSIRTVTDTSAPPRERGADRSAAVERRVHPHQRPAGLGAEQSLTVFSASRDQPFRAARGPAGALASRWATITGADARRW